MGDQMTSARERTLEAMGKTKTDVQPMKVAIDGQELIVDVRTLTGRDRRLMKAELAKLDYPADDEDFLYAAIWVVLRRSRPDVTFDEVLDAVTLGDLMDAEVGDVEGDDSPEA